VTASLDLLGTATKVSTFSNGRGEYTLYKLPLAAAFHCVQCDQEKTSKSIGQFVGRDKRSWTICNGCYGHVKAEGGIINREEVRGEDDASHMQRHRELHEAFNELVADYISLTHALPSRSTIADLMKWSFEQTKNPTGPRHL
jgi:hypothetical protein